MITISDLQKLPSNKKILLLGLGGEIWQFLDWLVEVVKFNPKQIILADGKSEIDFGNYQRSDFGGVFLGEGYLDSLQITEVETAFKAPGIWSLKPELQAFRNHRGEDKVLSSLVFFIQKFQNQIIGITGTKGKSTTSSLTNFLLQKSNFTSHYCGNTTGVSPFQFWTEIDQKIDPKEFFVMELSSFQLQDLSYSQISPKHSAITNYYIDHLDQHKNVEEYWAAKDNIFWFLPKDGLVVCHEELADKSTQLRLTNSKIILSHQNTLDLTTNLDSPLSGQHNQKNLALALCLLESVASQSNQKSTILDSISKQKNQLKSILSTYKGLPHRLELVKIISPQPDFEIRFYDDGYATETDAVVACVESLTGADNEFLWLFISGKDKGMDLQILVDKITEKKDQILEIEFCGEVGNNLAKKMGKPNHPKQIFKGTVADLRENFESKISEFQKRIQDLKLPKNNQKIVLNIAFSPCGSSFDEFKNYTERAEFWLEGIRDLK